MKFSSVCKLCISSPSWNSSCFANVWETLFGEIHFERTNSTTKFQKLLLTTKNETGEHLSCVKMESKLIIYALVVAEFDYFPVATLSLMQLWSLIHGYECYVSKRKIVFVWLEILQSCSSVIVHESCKLPSEKFLLSTSRSIPDSAFQSLVCLQIAAGWLRVLFLTTLIKKLREVPPGNNPVFKDHLTRDILHECKSCALFWYRFSLVNFFIKKALTVLLLESWLKNLSEESFLFSKMDAFTVAFKSMALALDSLFANVYFSLKMCHHLFQSTVSPLKNMQHLQEKKFIFVWNWIVC